MDYESMVQSILELQAAVAALSSTSKFNSEANVDDLSKFGISSSPVHFVIADPIVAPEKFSGSRNAYPISSFKLAVGRVFDLSGDRFPTERSKIAYIGNC